MQHSLSLGRLAGIPVKIHWTFFLLAGFIFLGALTSGAGMGAAVLNLMYVASVFGFVVLHELGHALMARRFGIGTSSIILLPIGGVASLSSESEEPGEELLIAAAGPAVNFVLAPVLFITGTLLSAGFLVYLAYINIALGLFNLIPAFPTDGGRILRAFLSMRMPRLKATELAVRTGKFFAVGLGIMGLMGNPMLVLIAVFIWMAGNAELNNMRWKQSFASSAYNPFKEQILNWAARRQDFFRGNPREVPRKFSGPFGWTGIHIKFVKPKDNRWLK